MEPPAERVAVVVDGATGYVGSHLVWKLRSLGHPVRCIVRVGAHPADLDFLRGQGAQVVEAELLGDDERLAEAFSASAVAVHLIGSIAPKKGETLEDLHTLQTRRFVEHCQDTGVPRAVMVTALGTAPGAVSVYHATKWQAEETLRSSGLEYAILRPSLIVGRLVGRRESKLVKRYMEMIASRAAIPLIHGGINKLQPVFIGDLVLALAKCVQSEAPPQGTLEIGGPDIVTMRELIEELMSVMGVRKPVVGLPGFLAEAIAGVCEAFQTVPVLSRDQVTMAGADNVCQENALVTVLGIEPTPLRQALETYLPESRRRDVAAASARRTEGGKGA